MNDSIPYYFNVVVNTKIIEQDSVVSDTLASPTVIDFLQLKSVNLSPIVNSVNSNNDVITYVLISLLGLIAFIWHFMPDRFALIFSMKLENQFLRSTGDANIKVPGTLITSFFWFNFISSSTIFIMILLQDYFSDEIVGLSIFQILSYILMVLVGLLFYRGIVIYSSSIIFKTQKMRKLQVVTGRNIQFITGVVLVPLILLILYIDSSVFLYLALIVIVVLQVIRLIKIMIIGKSSTMFSALHIILYLCALELAPILVLIGMIGNGSDVL